MQPIADIRKEYKQETLNEKDIQPNAYAQFEKWWDEALKSGLDEVNAMTLATVNEDGTPAARIVLLKGYSPNSGKVALLFFWAPLERQIRITGSVSKVSEEESDTYFNSRPAGSKIGAWASPQSLPIFNREVIEENEKKYTEKFSDTAIIPRPPHWGGYIVKPTQIEFWQGRPSRLHDRILYSLQTDKSWKIERLAP